MKYNLIYRYDFFFGWKKHTHFGHVVATAFLIISEDPLVCEYECVF